MSRLIAYILQVTGTFGVLFFLNYGHSTIPFREIWLVLSILVGATGIGTGVWQTLKQK